MKDWSDIEKQILADGEKMGMPFQDDYWGEMEALLDDNEEGPFQEAYWDEMSLILDKEDRKKRRALFFRWVVDSAAILLIGFVLFNHNSPISSSANNNVALDSDNTVNTQENEAFTTKAQNNTPNSTVINASEKTTNLSESMTNGSIPTASKELTEPTELFEMTGTVEPLVPIVAVTPTERTAPLEITEPSLPENTVVFNENTNANNSFDDLTISTDVGSLKTVAFNDIHSFNPSISTLGNTGKNRRNLLRPLSVNLFASSNVALAPKGNVSEKSRLGSNSTFGIEVLKHDVNWSYGLGVNVSHKTGLNHELSLTRSNYGTRLYRDNQTVTYKSISSIGIPVGVNYHRGRDVFGLRLAPTWNVLVNSTYHRYNNYNSDELLVKNNYGIKEGISPFDVRLQLMYQRRLTEKLSIGVNMTTGLINQIDPNVITNSDGLYEFSVGLNLNYTILNF